MSAEISLPKQEPPQPTPALRNLGPIRPSNPNPRTTSLISAPTRSQIFAISLAKLILVARNALAAYLIISAEARSVVTTGTAVNPAGRGAEGGGVKVCSIIGWYRARSRSVAKLLDAPITIRSG